jgi:hypothetical protein
MLPRILDDSVNFSADNSLTTAVSEKKNLIQGRKIEENACICGGPFYRLEVRCKNQTAGLISLR